jgi:hypothetical protein
VEFQKPSVPPEAGQPPCNLQVKPGALADTSAAPAKAKKRNDDDGEEKRGGGSAMIVLLSGGLGLLFVLGGLTLTGWFLFTQIDMEEQASNRPNNNRPNNPGNNPGNSGQKGNNNPNQPPKGNTGQIGGFPFDPPDPPKPKEMFFDLRPVPGTLTAITPPADLDEGVSKKFPIGRVDSVAVGGGGRYIVFHSPEGRFQLFDVNACDVVKEITMNENGNVLMTAGANTLVVALPNSPKQLRVYSLPALKQVNEFTLPMVFGARSITMGAGTNGPLLAVDPFGEAVLMDINTGKAIEGASGKIGIAHNQVRATHDGKMFLAGNGFRGDDKFSTLTESLRKWQVRSPDIASAYLSPDGKRIYGKNQIVSPNGDRIAGKAEGITNVVWYVPAVTATGNYFLRVNEARVGPKSKNGVSISLHKDKDVDKPVLPAWDGLTEAERLVNANSVLVDALDKHLFFIPEAKLLVILNHDKTQIVVRKLGI